MLGAAFGAVCRFRPDVFSPTTGAHRRRVNAGALPVQQMPRRLKCGHPKCQDERKRGRTGYDGAKKIKGRKRVELCDMGGTLLEVVVVPADTDERTCALAVLIQAKKSAWSRKLQTIFADSGFAGQEFEAQVQEQLGCGLRIVHRDKGQAGFVPLPKKWLIEQVFGCQGRNRRLCRDHEDKTYISRATIQVANLHRWLQ